MQSQNSALYYLWMWFEKCVLMEAPPSLTVSQQRATLLEGVETERGWSRGRGYGHGERRREDMLVLLPWSFTGSYSAQGGEGGGGRYEVMMWVSVSCQVDHDVPASSNSDGEVVLSASWCHCCSLLAWKPIIIRIFCSASASAMVAAVRPAKRHGIRV